MMINDDPVLSKLVTLAGELVALQALAQYAREHDIDSEELEEAGQRMDSLMEDLVAAMSSRIVSMAQIEKYRRSSSYGKELPPDAT